MFPIGEVNGSHGVYRPGGSALNSSQVGGFRAAQYIAQKYKEKPLSKNNFSKIVKKRLVEMIELFYLLNQKTKTKHISIDKIKSEIQKNMTRHCANVRSKRGIKKALKDAYLIRNRYNLLTLSSREDLLSTLRVRELILTYILYLEAINAYIERYKKSRGSYIILNRKGTLPTPKLNKKWCFEPMSDISKDEICEIWYTKNMDVKIEWRKTRPIPAQNNWFEKVWNDFRNDSVIK
jgi:succinate dehydrogenase/fumarate reductase flavoprotein subunit